MQTSARSQRQSATEHDPRWRAVLARDAAADGRFYYGVRTSGVYCRPSCASRRPRPENVSFHRTAAEAEAAGLRPCKRCLPNTPRVSAPPARLRYTIALSLLGQVLVAVSDRGVRAVMLGNDRAALEAEVRADYPQAEAAGDDARVAALAAAVVRCVDAPGEAAPPEMDVRGTPFQREVWDALGRIPAGCTASYAELARQVGRPSAVRAVGAACGANQHAVLIPCHRAVGSDGKLTGYRWGLERKKALLEREAAGVG
jgi:AraC family transcriptional regulator of adaptative response/methylated-DNA-[protein]-cysteine methyltransferase